jgi:EAL domain-containing protein (putative c-di-GMP-specific phosphodiesterase class I)
LENLLNSLSIQYLIESGNFHHYYQSLFSMKNWERIGGEILFRSDFGTPDVIFQNAKAVNKLYELETKSIYKLFNDYPHQESTLKGLIFINIFPSTVLHIEFPDFIRKLARISTCINKKIVFEIIERDYVEDIQYLKERIDLLKGLGYLVAIDDVGKGWSSLNMIIELEPHFLKLDQYFSINLSASRQKQEMIKSLLQYTTYTGSKVVLEGIEQEADLAMAKALGVDICQGYLLGRPQPIVSAKY